MITDSQKIYKRIFDLFFALLGIVFLSIPVLLITGVIYIKTGENGFFIQERVGQYGKVFRIIKIKTIHRDLSLKIFSVFLRKTKLDELPQLINIFKGDMSFVGPRPDIEGFADKLKGTDRIVLNVKPGLTGPASLAFYNEEFLLSQETNSKDLILQKIWEEKIRLNIMYVKNYTLLEDIKYVMLTLLLMVKTKRNI